MYGLTPIRALKRNGILFHKERMPKAELAHFRAGPDLYLAEPGEESGLYLDGAGNLCICDWAACVVEAESDRFREEDFLFQGNFLTGQVGLLKFENRMGEAVFLDEPILVVSRKLSQEEYREMLTFTDQALRTSVWSARAGTYGRVWFGGAEETHVPYHKLLLLRAWLQAEEAENNLPLLCAYIARNPASKLESAETMLPIGGLDCMDADVVEELASAPGPRRLCAKLPPGGRRLIRGGRCYVPESVRTERADETFDCAENQFVKYFLEQCLALLSHFRSRAAVEAEYHAVAGLLRTPFFKALSPLSAPPRNSTVLQHRAGYAQVFRMYLQFVNTSAPLFSEEKLSLYLEEKNVNVIYEFFCFFQVYGILRELYTHEPQVCIRAGENEWERTLRRDASSHIQFAAEGDLPALSLFYNKTYSGARDVVSHPLRPDISLELAADSGRRRILVFDAKFRMEADGAGVKNTDLDKMHTYRDAIRDVIGAFALYPGTQTALYPSNSTSPQEYDGVGAFPLKPGNPAQRGDLQRRLEAFLKTIKALA